MDGTDHWYLPMDQCRSSQPALSVASLWRQMNPWWVHHWMVMASIHPSTWMGLTIDTFPWISAGHHSLLCPWLASESRWTRDGYIQRWTDFSMKKSHIFLKKNTRDSNFAFTWSIYNVLTIPNVFLNFRPKTPPCIRLLKFGKLLRNLIFQNLDRNVIFSLKYSWN